jgi:hypothetical protein
LKRLLFLLALPACIDAIDPRWQLDHDHVIAARATPPRIREGENTGLDALVAHETGPVTVEAPMSAEVSRTASGPDFSRYLTKQVTGEWTLHAPDAAILASARPAMGLPADAPVPVDVLLTFPHGGTDRASLDAYRVKKTVWIGEPSANPDLPAVTIDGAPAGDEVVIPVGRDVYVSLDAPAGTHVNWLTNVGQLFQDDVATAYLHVAPEDRREGQLVVVMRDSEGGVAWRVWSMRAE